MSCPIKLVSARIKQGTFGHGQPLLGLNTFYWKWYNYILTIAYMSQIKLFNKTDENLRMEKEQRNKNLEFLTRLFEYSLKNNFVDALEYLGINSRHLIPSLSLFVSLNAETKECFVFSHRKVKRSYLSFVLENIREFALKISVDLNPSEYSIKILPDDEFISDDGLA